VRKKKKKEITHEEKVKVVNMVVGGKALGAVEKITGIPDSTIMCWLADETINPNKEYVLNYREDHPWLAKRMKKSFKQREPFKEGVPENPADLIKENRDLRKKIAYLEDKVDYLETLYEILSTSPDKVSKKKDSKQS